MKKLNINNQKIKEKATKLAENRKNIFSEKLREQIILFEENQIEPISLIHFILKQKPEKKLLNYAIKNYIINLISLWETFFRDIFVFILKMDNNFKMKIIQNYVKNNENLNDENIEDYLALIANFQNLNDLNETFKILFNNENILNIIGKYEQNIFMHPYIIKNFSIDKTFQNWKKKIEKTFELRHQFIHDANFKYNFKRKEIQETEILFNVIPKTFANIIADKYKLKRLVTKIENNQIKYIYLGYGNYNYISSIEDIISNDWIIKN